MPNPSALHAQQPEAESHAPGTPVRAIIRASAGGQRSPALCRAEERPESSMSIVVRDVREHELDSVLALNNAAGPAILPLDAAKLRSFFDTAEYFRVAERDGTIAGFLVGFGSDAAHDSDNFAWFRGRSASFFYIDRIVV